MASTRWVSDIDRGSSKGVAVTSLMALLGVALALEYLVPGEPAPEKAAEKSSGSRNSRPTDSHSVVSEDRDRGRGATTPYEIPARGWKDILLRVYENVSKHRIMALAAGMTYYSILAIFPAIAALVSVYSLFSDPSMIAKHLDQLNGFMPGGAVDVAREQLTRIASKGSQALGVTFLIGFAISLWSANAAMKALFDTLNIVYGEEEKRGFIKLNAVSLLFTVSAIVFVVAALGSLVVIPVFLNMLGLSHLVDLLVRIGRWPAMYLIIALALAVIYRYGASRETPQWRWTTWGSAVAALLWLGVSGLFSWYASSFGNFNETYGSLGAVIGFMTWLWLSAIVVLLGAEIDAETEHQTASDSTTGAPKPIGARGARVADTVGAARAA